MGDHEQHLQPPLSPSTTFETEASPNNADPESDPHVKIFELKVERFFEGLQKQYHERQQRYTYYFIWLKL